MRYEIKGRNASSCDLLSGRRGEDDYRGRRHVLDVAEYEKWKRQRTAESERLSEECFPVKRCSRMSICRLRATV